MVLERTCIAWVSHIMLTPYIKLSTLSYLTSPTLLHSTDPHLIAWFSAGAFVILGFPISIYGILGHLTNYYQPNVQCYVVRILWMVRLFFLFNMKFSTLIKQSSLLCSIYNIQYQGSNLQHRVLALPPISRSSNLH